MSQYYDLMVSELVSQLSGLSTDGFPRFRLLQVPELQSGACKLLVDIGKRWPAALAGSADEVSSLLPLPMARRHSRRESLRLLRTLAACGEAGRVAVASSAGLIREINSMLTCAALTSAVTSISCATADEGADMSPKAPSSSTYLCRQGEEWIPGQATHASPFKSPSHVRSTRQAPVPIASKQQQEEEVMDALLEAEATAAVLLSLLSSSASATEICRHHRTVVDPVCRLFHALANSYHDSKLHTSVLRLLIGETTC